MCFVNSPKPPAPVTVPPAPTAPTNTKDQLAPVQPGVTKPGSRGFAALRQDLSIPVPGKFDTSGLTI